ncbi:alkaline phosphatase family protein [Stratiformator vulcanicus]|uniref:Type I phosphodiesterase / nucleotide pyrophosphatase n=1 Tax=Stratiformator vulcanicus TaxID=2527980 RepID=A0A517R0A4_9PLAN|nr:nucleotide pyrophosphatase/phosphodiesterase family protein [Stratiformator vulcanicus]QDT37311.1 Type I phosphodiesterase / nucleotide pyrophosphatase [Stratiformator vulcanicus]
MKSVVLLSIPGLRSEDIAKMPSLKSMAERGGTVPLSPTFPCVTCPVQISLSTGTPPSEHGVIANGFFWRDRGEVEMWTAWDEVIESPRLWDRLRGHDSSLTSAVWFPMLSKGTSADYVCTPAPIHNPDGSESLWCYTKPEEYYGELRDSIGHFPLMNFWGPLSSIKSSAWIVDSAIHAARKYEPRFFWIYLPHLDYAAQKYGPDSDQAAAALVELDREIAKLSEGLNETLPGDVTWLAASEYVITPVSDVQFPNRLLRELGLLSIDDQDGAEHLNPARSDAWALVDHQFAHVFVKNAEDVERIAQSIRDAGIAERVLVGSERAAVGLDHPRAGEIVLVSRSDSWFAYYWWTDDAKAPAFARTVDIHRKPGYDPVEMFIDMPSKQTPLDATLVKGSHGYPADDDSRRGVLIASSAGLIADRSSGVSDTDVAKMVLSEFGIDYSDV